MKQTLVVKRAPAPSQSAALLRTSEVFNAACTDLAATAAASRSTNKIELQQLVYYDIRQRFGLSAQMCIRAISKVAEAYKRDREKQPSFRPHGAMPYDERIMNCARPERASLLTLDGRVVVSFRFGAYQPARLDRIRGQCDRLFRNGTFYWACTVDAPEPTPDQASEYLGVDLGIITITITITSDGEIVNRGQAGCVQRPPAHVNTVRARNRAVAGQAPEEAHEERQAPAPEAQRQRAPFGPQCQPLYQQGHWQHGHWQHGHWQHGHWQHGERHPTWHRP